MISTNQAEVWKLLPGPIAYLVSNLGRVKRRARSCIIRFKDKTVRRYLPDKILVGPALSQYGYQRIRIYGRVYFVHQLVAQMFCPRHSPDAISVNHKNGIKTDNRAENLEWVTNAENSAHAKRTGLMKNRDSLPYAKITSEDIRQIATMLDSGLHPAAVAKLFDVAPRTISHVVRRFK